MKEFLYTIYFENPVYRYLYVLGIVLLSIVLKRVLSKYIASLLFLLVKRIWNVPKKAFTTLIIKPLGNFLIILITLITFEKLHFPTDLNFSVYKVSLKEIIDAGAIITLISVFIWLLIRMIDFIAIILEEKANKTTATTDNQLIVFFKDFFKVILVIVGVLLILRFAFHENIGSLLTGLSIVGAAIALSTRESLENLIASFIIFFDKPFATGDTVKVLNITGVIEKIGLRSTRIRTDQKTLITVPNKQMVDSVLDNISLRSLKRADVHLEVSLNTSTTELQKLIEGIKAILKNEYIQSSNVYFSDIQKNAFLIVADYYIPTDDEPNFEHFRQEINIQISQLIEKIGVQYAGASTEIRIAKREA